MSSGRNVGRPACFTAEEWAEWRKMLWQRQDGAEFYSHYCGDCTPDYKRKMSLRGLCSHPETLFRVVDGGVVGIRGKEGVTCSEG